MMPTLINGNGALQQRSTYREALTTPLTEGYASALPLWALGVWGEESLPQLYMVRDVELMLIHPIVTNALDYFSAGIAGIVFEGPDGPDNEPLPISDNPEVAQFVLAQCNRWRDRGIPKVQGAYPYGWIGCEALYDEADGKLFWDDLRQFAPRDTYLLTRDREPVGVRVRNILSKGDVDLFTASIDVPAKGLWYAHRPRYQSYYGQSQLLKAWRPWRRLAWKNGAESVLDMGVYRYGVPSGVVRFPNEDYQAANNAPATTFDGQGNPRRYARDEARQIAEWLKSGAWVGLSSEMYPSEMGGGQKWSMDSLELDLNISGLIENVKHLWEQIYFGVGVPPEMITASEGGGSGYSGRKIPREAFLQKQQAIADAMLHLFIDQVLRPLVRWNWGPSIRFSVKVKNLLKQERQAQTGADQPSTGDKGTVPPQPLAGEPNVNPQPPGVPGAQPQRLFSINSTQPVSEYVKEVSKRILARAAA